MKKKSKCSEGHNNQTYTSPIYFDTSSEEDSDSSYEEALLSSINAMNSNTSKNSRDIKNKSRFEPENVKSQPIKKTVSFPRSDKPSANSSNIKSRSTNQNSREGESKNTLINQSNLSSPTSIKSIRSTDSKPTESRVEFVKHILDGNKLQPMIDFSTTSTNPSNSECDRLNKKTIDARKLFNSLNVTLEYIKSGTSGHTFKATSIMDENIAFAIKVCAYPKTDDYGSIKNPKRPENAEIIMLKLLSSFVLNMKTPHFILPIGAFNTSIGPFVNVPPKLVDLKDEKNETYRKFIERCKNDEFEELVSVLISEWANGGDLLDYIRKNYKQMTLQHWTVIIFQILYTLASLHKKFELFRHNDMKANNILVRFTDSDYSESLYGYKRDDVKFQIPDIGIQIKIWDFDFACIKGKIENNKVNSEWTTKMNVSNEKNQYYDMHYFFNTLISERFFPQFYTGGAPKEIIEFIHRIVPPKYRTVSSTKYIRKGGRILTDLEYTTPYEVIMHDELFDKYRYPDKI